MGGAITNITAVKHGLATYDPDVVQGTVLDRAEVDRQIELYRVARRRRAAARSSGSSRNGRRSSWPAPASSGP
jgi:cobyrinic acid a,c-diamide synthase